MSNVMEKAKIN